jgi:hypothetical protein
VAERPKDLSPLRPLATGKRLRITKLDDRIAPLEIVVPPGFKLHFEGGEELAPSAHLVGPDVEIIVSPPEAGFFSLADRVTRIAQSDPAAQFIRAAEDTEGFLLVDRNDLTDRNKPYDTIVSRPKLKVHCEAFGLRNLSDAELVASVCLTLRSVLDRTGQ